MPGDPATDGGAPIDFDLLEEIGRHLEPSERFETVEYRPPYAPESVIARYDSGWYPPSVEEAFIEIRWYRNDDFTIHYQEHWRYGDERRCRWDRHPNEHNTRDHYHALPDAETPGTDESYPAFWKDVLSMVLQRVDSRIDAFWTENEPNGSSGQ